jgi:hypothetical protein
MKKIHRPTGLAFILWYCSVFLKSGIIATPTIAKNIIATPPALWGIDRKIA